jgi:hypothetical protein
MRRFFWLLVSDLKLARTAIPIHLVAIVQPTLFFLILALGLVHPTFDVKITQPDADIGVELISAMQQVGEPSGTPYIEAEVIDTSQLGDRRQLITVSLRGSEVVVIQKFGLIDANQVKNLRNRLTAASLIVWNQRLGNQAVRIEEHPWVPVDVPYPVYFGIALLPMAAFVGASFVGATIVAQDFEFGTELEYQLSPTSPILIITARLVRILITGLASATVLLLTIGIRTGYWPDGVWLVFVILFPIALIAGCVGMVAAYFTRKTIPAFVLCLLLSIGTWIFGGSFALPSNFGGAFESISRLTPNIYAVELIFPLFYKRSIGAPMLSELVLTSLSLFLIIGVYSVYRWRIVASR